MLGAWCLVPGARRREMKLWYNLFIMTDDEIRAFFGGHPESSDWYDVTDPTQVMDMPVVDISSADRLRDRKEMKRVFHAFGRVENESDGRLVVFPAASVGKMWFMSGIDVRNMAAEFANLFRGSIRGWSEPNKKIPEGDKRRKMERVHQYKGAELSTPIKTRAEDPAPFVDNKIALFLSAVNGAK